MRNVPHFFGDIIREDKELVGLRVHVLVAHFPIVRDVGADIDDEGVEPDDIGKARATESKAAFTF